jgi:pimeloyl-ACP methyl ester carboxylesterase
MKLEAHVLGDLSCSPLIAAAHPAESFGKPTADLLARMADTTAIAISPRDEAQPLEQMVDDIEETRRALGVDRWVFWGMSGGGWLALLYAHRHPKALKAIIVESGCACFKARLADPACVLSPAHPMWRDQPVAPESTWRSEEGGPPLVRSPMPLSPMMRRAMPVLYAFDARPWLAKLDLPALLISGSVDPLVPVVHARALHQAIRGSELHIIEGASHVPTGSEHPEVATHVRRFLARLAAREGDDGDRARQ